LDIETLMKSITSQYIFSETEVRTKVAIPLFKLLGYPDHFRSEEFPIYGYDGRKQLNTKFADLLFFDHSDFNHHRKREDCFWVQEHSKVVVELKKPSESMDAQGQAVFYSMWARAPLYIITNGKEIAAYRTEGFVNDKLLFKYRIEELPVQWARIQQIIGWEAVLDFYRSKSEEDDPFTEDSLYLEYTKASYFHLEELLRTSYSRLVKEDNKGLFRDYSFPLNISSNIYGNYSKTEPYENLLQKERPIVILAEPGGGKSYLLQMIAYDLFKINLSESSHRIPVLLYAKLWNRSFHSLTEAIYNEIKSFIPFLTISKVEEDLQKGKYLILLDGLDEVVESVDTLYDELTRMARNLSIRILATCRRENYFEELRETFDTCSLKPLDDEQIQQYAQMVLGDRGHLFLHRIGKSLSALVRNPLFLFMTVEIIKRSGAAEIPKNKAQLYSFFTKILLNDWFRMKASPKKQIADQSTKESILSEYAQKTFRRTISSNIFNETVAGNVGKELIFQVKEELLDSGLLKTGFSGPEFYHPSFQEYFFALYLSAQEDDSLIKFIKTYHLHDSYQEVFIYLAGLLREKDSQSVLLDFLEKQNLSLYYNCLKAKFDRTEQIKLNWSAEFILEYFAQVRKSYLSLIENHFYLVRDFLHPWRRYHALNSTSDDDISINGSMDLSRPSIAYHFELVKENEQKSRVNIESLTTSPVLMVSRDGGVQKEAIPIGSFSTSDGYMFYDLDWTSLGVDSAREVALDAIKKQLKDILKSKLLFTGEDHSIGCEIVEKELKMMRSGIVVPMPEELKNLSLYTHSIEDLIHILTPYQNISGFRHPDGYVKEVNISLIMYYILKMNMDKINLQSYLMPIADLKWEDLPKEKLYVWSNWSEKQLCLKIGRFYDAFQDAYRYMVESCFPSLKNELYFYSVGPVRFTAIIHRPEEKTRGGYVDLSWRPVREYDSASTIVQVAKDNNEKKDSRKEFDEIAQQLRQLGRKYHNISIGSGCLISGYTGSDKLLREEVYKQLQSDFEQLFK
jgi:hypothetical protein